MELRIILLILRLIKKKSLTKDKQLYIIGVLNNSTILNEIQFCHAIINNIKILMLLNKSHEKISKIKRFIVFARFRTGDLLCVRQM